MASLNKVMLIGNVGNDPELMCFENSDSKMCKLALATNSKWKDKNNVIHEKTEWHQLIFFNKIAEIAHKYYSKGRQIYVEGKIQTRSWTDRDGIVRYTSEIIVEYSQLLGNNNNNSKNNTSTVKLDNKNKSTPSDEFDGWVDDDIPF